MSGRPANSIKNRWNSTLKRISVISNKLIVEDETNLNFHSDEVYIDHDKINCDKITSTKRGKYLEDIGLEENIFFDNIDYIMTNSETSFIEADFKTVEIKFSSFDLESSIENEFELNPFYQTIISHPYDEVYHFSPTSDLFESWKFPHEIKKIEL